jgi:two-component system chemotaxis response regulator CheY
MHTIMGFFSCVLIVEDNQDIREALREVVAWEGYQVIEAENGRVALDILNSGKMPEPCLILLDLLMPEMNGWEFMEFRRRNDAIAAIPTIIITAMKEGTLPQGAIKVIQKPIDLVELVSAIDGFCSRHKEETDSCDKEPAKPSRQIAS